METARILELPPALKRRLVHLRQLTGATQEPHLREADVMLAQQRIGRPLGDAFLALMANHDEALEAYDLDLARLPGLTKEAHIAGMPFGFVALGRAPESEVYVGATPLGSLVMLFDPNDGEETRQLGVEAWLDELIAEEIEKLRDDLSDDKARVYKLVKDADVAAYTPALVRPTAGERRHVQHPKFGVGEVLRELEGGEKLEIRFDSGTKTLMARFVRELIG
ncbi:MAG: hypothetical protein AAGH15_17950 [Myxococcota bacterium]